MTQLLAYHGKPSIKNKFIARVKAHRLADRLIKGTGWENGKGCAVGCTLEKYDHYQYPQELGVPVAWAYVQISQIALQELAACALLHRGECPDCGYAPWDAEGHELDALCPTWEDDHANQIGGVAHGSGCPYCNQEVADRAE